MLKIHYKVQFCLFVICLFFIGIGIVQTIDEGFKTERELFGQISHFVPFTMGAIIFGNNLYFKRIQNFKKNRDY